MGIYTVLVLAACINGWLLWHGSLMEMIANAKNHLVYIVALPVAFHTLRDRRDQNLVLLAASFSLFCNFLQGINYSKDAFLTGNLERRRAQALIAIQPNAFGAAIAMYFSIFLLLALYKVGSRGTRLWYWILTLTGGFTLILTLSRGSWMGVAAGIAVAALFRARRLLIVIAIAGLTYQLWLPQQAIDRAQSTIEQDGEFEGEIEGSTAMRIEQYKSLPAMMAPKPVFGWGYKSFPRVFEKYGTLKRAKGAHSSYCQYGTEMGVIGLVALIAVLARNFWTGVRAARFAPHPMHQWIGVGIMAGIVAMAVSMGSGARWDPQKMFVFFWCFVAIAERETALALLPGNARRYGGQAPAVAADDQGS
jgi:O-antigen ligase